MLTFNQINGAMRNAPSGGHGASFLGRPLMLRAPEGDGGGGAGNGGGEGGLDQKTINSINAAVTSQLTRAIDKLPLQQLISQGIANALPTALEGVTTKMTETLGAQIAKLAPVPGVDDKDAGGKGKGKGGEPDGALVKLQSQLDELTTKLADKDRQLSAQQEEQATAKMVDEARAAFAKAGIKEPMIDAVIALHQQRGTFKRDKDGAHVKITKKTNHGTFEDRLDLDGFAKEWAGSDEGKNYIPAADPGRRRTGRGAADMLRGDGRQAPDFRLGDEGNKGQRRGPTQQEQAEGDRSLGEGLIDWYQGSGDA